jgi:Leucine-rich repeat (LRR) protein
MALRKYPRFPPAVKIILILVDIAIVVLLFIGPNTCATRETTEQTPTMIKPIPPSWSQLVCVFTSATPTPLSPESQVVNNHFRKAFVTYDGQGRIRELEMCYTSLTYLPSEIGDLSRLSGLDLSHNHLSGLPSEIGQLGYLTKLDLSDNRLTEIPADIGELHRLTELDLSNNRLTHLPPQIGQLTNLRRLAAGNRAVVQPGLAQRVGLRPDPFTT